MTLPSSTETIQMRTDVNGVVRLSNTRVTLDTVIAAFWGGATAEEIVHQYPSLDLADVYAAIAYYLRNRTEVDAYLKRRAQTRAKIRTSNQRRYDESGIRERLMRRRASSRR